MTMDSDFESVPAPPKARRPPAGASYPWVVLGLLWFCGFFNYADRQALYSVFQPLKEQFQLDDDQLGWIGSAFMIVYASTAPLAGFVVDRVSRRVLVPVGLAFWSLVCAATGYCGTYWQLIAVRAAEGLGESFYFPASMSLLADYHGPRTRSRALSIHQTSVYLGTAGGAVLAGGLAKRYGWPAPFLALGLMGMLYAVVLAFWLVEPERGQTERAEDAAPEADLTASMTLWDKVARILSNRAALLLLLVFVGANFVASTFLTWLPTFILRKFEMDVSNSSLTSTAWPLASLVGALCGGVLADWRARHRKGGRIQVQSLGLILGAPFVYWAGVSSTLPVLVTALLGAGLCKGIYDANIFASLFDVVAPEDRGTAAGLMNSVGWTGGFLAPVAVGYASKYYGLSVAIGSTAVVYFLVGILALFAARAAERPSRAPG
ncbi:MFS transporter [Paludisphaera borealis]|uniref:Putative L-galactonate transporter n=1 Tax=Paludisphaera borealis TaxID=1387353 RepID=A0A1U7CYL9_9BACT|nr:MFS transporter [Paludisphaera borealis]APW63988.1 putative L-galactonate transporter [Paludisphaera borealis]